MTQLFALLLTLNAPALDAGCVAWTKTTKTTAKKTEACITHFLTHAYSGEPTAEALSLDPMYGQLWEPKVTTAQLNQAVAHVDAVCKDDVGSATRCDRAREFFQGLIGRKTSTFENMAIGSFEGLLKKVLAGQALTVEDLSGPEPDIGYSALTLWRLRNAAYARHGYQFKSPDLNLFFYHSPKKEGAALPLPVGTLKTVALTAIDGANVRLIKSLEAKLKK